MHDRIKMLRKELHLTQQELADKIGVKRSTIAQYEVGRNEPIDVVIKTICEKLNANEVWLRTGEGEMFVKKDTERELAEFLADVASDRENSARRQLIRIMARLPEEMWETIEQILKEFAEES